MRGQAALELLVTVAIILAFTIPVVFLLMTVAQYGYEDTAITQADASARMLADNINDVYWQGTQAKRSILISLPANTKEIRISGNEVVITVVTSSGEYETVSPVFAQVEDTELKKDVSGLIDLNLQVSSEGKVEVWR